MMLLRLFFKYLFLVMGYIFKYNRSSKILFYHDIYASSSYKSYDCDILMGTSLDLFKKHLLVIKRSGYKIVTYITHPENEVAIMFDDGFRGIWDNRDFFYEQGICPTVFLAVELIGKDGFLTESEILELQSHGFIFECHSWSHTNLAIKSEKELVRELGESRAYLSKLLGKDVKEICLPIGYFSDFLINQLQLYGYNEIYSSIPGNYYERCYKGMRPRNLCQFASPYELKLILHGGLNLIRCKYERMHRFPDYAGNDLCGEHR